MFPLEEGWITFTSPFPFLLESRSILCRGFPLFLFEFAGLFRGWYNLLQAKTQVTEWLLYLVKKKINNILTEWETIEFHKVNLLLPLSMQVYFLWYIFFLILCSFLVLNVNKSKENVLKNLMFSFLLHGNIGFSACKKIKQKRLSFYALFFEKLLDIYSVAKIFSLTRDLCCNKRSTFQDFIHLFFSG